MSINVRGLISWIIVFQIIGYLLGMLTAQDISTWYSTLHKPILTPPNIVFPIVWIILYVMLTVAGYTLWQNRHQAKTKLALIFYFAQLFLNWAWTPLFFYLHWIGVSLVCITAIILLTLITIVLTRNTYKLSCIMLIPYFFWLLFAAYLNAMIWILNS